MGVMKHGSALLQRLVQADLCAKELGRQGLLHLHFMPHKALLHVESQTLCRTERRGNEWKVKDHADDEGWQ